MNPEQREKLAVQQAMVEKLRELGLLSPPRPFTVAERDGALLWRKARA